MQHYDLAIIGAGMTGTLLARRIALLGLSVCLVEQREPEPFSPEQAMDVRVSALSLASVDQLQGAGAWDAIQKMRVCPYRRLACWEDPDNELLFESHALGLESLGQMVENRIIQLGLWQQLQTMDNVHWYKPCSVANLIQDQHQVTLTLSQGEALSASVVVAADGAYSLLRQMVGIGQTSWDYDQRCMLVSVRTELPQQDITWQQFYPSGPRAFLPLCGHHGSLVWYDSPKTIKGLMQLSKEQLKDTLTDAFPARLGAIEVVERGSFALTRRHAHRYCAGRVVLLGDAAHTIHPMAGQGVNLGFKDVALFSRLSEQALGNGHWSDCDWLEDYERGRKRDNLLMQGAMDLFYHSFNTECAPMKLLRNIGLWSAERSGPLKRRAMKYALGLHD